MEFEQDESSALVNSYDWPKIESKRQCNFYKWCLRYVKKLPQIYNNDVRCGIWDVRCQMPNPQYSFSLTSSRKTNDPDYLGLPVILRMSR